MASRIIACQKGGTLTLMCQFLEKAITEAWQVKSFNKEQETWQVFTNPICDFNCATAQYHLLKKQKPTSQSYNKISKKPGMIYIPGGESVHRNLCMHLVQTEPQAPTWWMPHHTRQMLTSGATMHTYAAQGLSPMNVSQLQIISWNIFLKHALAIKTQPSHWPEGIILQGTSLWFTMQLLKELVRLLITVYS